MDRRKESRLKTCIYIRGENRRASREREEYDDYWYPRKKITQSCFSRRGAKPSTSGEQCITHLSEGPPRARTLTEITNQTWGRRVALLLLLLLLLLLIHLFLLLFFFFFCCVPAPGRFFPLGRSATDGIPIFDTIDGQNGSNTVVDKRCFFREKKQTGKK